MPFWAGHLSATKCLRLANLWRTAMYNIHPCSLKPQFLKLYTFSTGNTEATKSCRVWWNTVDLINTASNSEQGCFTFVFKYAYSCGVKKVVQKPKPGIPILSW